MPLATSINFSLLAADLCGPAAAPHLNAPHYVLTNLFDTNQARRSRIVCC
jgi:hypothetical protein